MVECLGVPGIRLQVLPPKRAPDRISPLSTSFACNRKTNTKKQNTQNKENKQNHPKNTIKPKQNKAPKKPKNKKTK